MRYRYQKNRVPYNAFGKIIIEEPRKFPHEIHFDIKEQKPFRIAYPKMYKWLREEVGVYNQNWCLRTVQRRKLLSFRDKEKALLFKLTFDGLE